MEPQETIEYKGYTIKVWRDELVGSPREEWDNLGTMAIFSRDLSGDKHEYSLEFIQEVFEGKHDDRFIWLPLRMYSHSGVGLSTSASYYPFNCPWDSGWCGVILVDKDKVRREYGWKLITKKRQRTIEDYLRNEVATYDQYLQGDVYYFEVEDDFSQIDGCGGFYGFDYAVQEAKSMVDWHIKAERERRAKMDEVETRWTMVAA